MADRKHFYEMLPPDSIVCRSTISSRNRLLYELLQLLKRHDPKLDLNDAVSEVSAREEMFPTVIAPGLAVPHARMNGLAEPLLALACTPDGVDFRSESGDVKVTILLLTPVDEPNLHLQMLSEIAKTFHDPDLIDRLVECATPEQVLEVFCSSCQEMGRCLTAGDLMDTPSAILRESDSLSDAIRAFATTQHSELVVLDRDGDLRGVLSLGDILKYCLPEHLLWMDDLSPIDHFQPFADVLKSSADAKVADLMHTEFVAVEKTAPAIQLAKLFTREPLRQLIITDDGGFVGVVELKKFCSRIFWE